MKNFAILLIGLITLSSTTFATTTTTSETTARYNAVYDGSRYIFVENGIEFSVFPDGEFDFYIPEIVQGVNINAGNVGISFNTGYNYDPFVQYDQFGAVIQIENTPVFYDDFGRLVQAGDVRINYRRNRIVNVGGLFVHYNNFGAFSHYTGFVNIYNRNYVFHPYHNFFYRPVFNRCLVWTTPYRQFYNPLRFNYAFHRNNYARGFRNGYANARRDFRRPNTGRVAHNNGRRDNVDRNNVAFRNTRSDRATKRGNRGYVSNNARDGRNGVRGDARDGRSGVRGDARDGRNGVRGDARDGRNGVRGDARVNRTNPRGIAANSNRKDRAIKGTTSRATKPNSRGTNRSVRGNATTRSNRATTTKRNNTNRKATSNRSTPQRRATSKPSTSRNMRATSSKSRNTSSRATSRSTSSRSKASSRSNTSRSSRATKSKSSNGRRG